MTILKNYYIIYVKRCLTSASEVLSLENLQRKLIYETHILNFANKCELPIMSTSQCYVVYMKISKYTLFSQNVIIYMQSVHMFIAVNANWKHLYRKFKNRGIFVNYNA